MSRWAKLVLHFKKKFPIKGKLVVRRCAMKCAGTTTFCEGEKQITICIRKSDKFSAQKDTLVHELAHVLEFNRFNDHGEYWGQCHAEVYRAWLDFSS